MSELDQALDTLRQDFNATSQAKYYDVFLNATFFVPTVEAQKSGGTGKMAEDAEVMPLVIEAEGKDYLVFFDSKERLHAWARTDVPCVEVPGHVLAATTDPPLHWALNVGTPYSKEFRPDEIDWLKDSVERCNAEAASGAASSLRIGGGTDEIP